MSASADIMARYEQVMFSAAAPYHGDNPLVVDHAKDQYIWDIDGVRYLDFFGGILTVSVGHCNDEITARTIEQLGKNPAHLDDLCQRGHGAPGGKSGGADARAACKNATSPTAAPKPTRRQFWRRACNTGNPVIITLRHAYSGRSMLAMSHTAHGKWRLGGVVDPYIKHVRNPYTFRAPAGLTDQQVVELCVQDLEETIATTTEGKIAAFMAEPIQGRRRFHRAARRLFRAHHAHRQSRRRTSSSATKCRPAGGAPAASGSALNTGAWKPTL